MWTRRQALVHQLQGHRALDFAAVILRQVPFRRLHVRWLGYWGLLTRWRSGLRSYLALG